MEGKRRHDLFLKSKADFSRGETDSLIDSIGKKAV
jgi:hypothetical protein